MMARSQFGDQSRKTDGAVAPLFLFMLYGAFTKLVGWGATPEPLTGEVIRRKYPAEKKGTMGAKIRQGDNDVMAPDHITLGCVGQELSAENLEKIASVVDETTFEGVEVQAVATTEFGPNVVVLFQFLSAAAERAFRQLDSICTREGQTENRIYHATAPVKFDADGNLVKKFPDVEEDRFLFWKRIIENLPSWKGLDDTEIFNRVTTLRDE